MKKILCLLLSCVIVLSVFTGCGFRTLAFAALEYLSTFMEQEDTSWQRHVQYTLDQQMLDEFYAVMEETEQLSVSGEDIEAVDQATQRLEVLYDELIDQSQIAYILYCADQSDEVCSRRYLQTNELVTQAEADYNAMLKRVYLSDTPIRDHLFEDWSQLDIDLLLAYNEEIARLEQRNTEITLEFRELDSDTWQEDMIPLYNELVINNNQIAQVYGYDNYYTYASEVLFRRDYGQQERELLRQYVAQYIPELCVHKTEQFGATYDQLTEDQKVFFSQLQFESFDRLSENYVQLYLTELSESAGKSMINMFEEDRVIIKKSADAYEGAFTTFIDGKPFCYFGPEYDDSETIIHELGHYYGSGWYEPWQVPIDLSETHSQGNEWLYLRFLQEQLDPLLYQSILDYKLVVELSNLLVFVMIDAFEQQIYSHENAGNMTLEEYNAVMEDVAQPFGGISYITQNIMDVQLYWKHVVLESPVYYISYAVSSVAAMDLFSVAQTDEETARSIYCKLIEEGDSQQGFLWNIQQAGLSGPFEETVYEKLKNIS